MYYGKKYTPVETIIDPYDVNIVWYYIPGFNGYEISNTNIVRSMKHFKKYPFGILIHPVSGTGDNTTFEITNDNNERVRITVGELSSLAHNNKNVVSGYPRRTYISDNHSRNKVINKHISNPGANYHYAKFTIIKD